MPNKYLLGTNGNFIITSKIKKEKKRNKIIAEMIRLFN